jgi:hypothetical protein
MKLKSEGTPESFTGGGTVTDVRLSVQVPAAYGRLGMFNNVGV